ncbi:MAG: DUF1553 domain-containing protein [Verrucomicrobiales bacterium]
MVGLGTERYTQDKGENLYRRTLYNFWKRMAPSPNMDIFNAPSREVCCVRRDRTNTPLQALVTMNDPQFIEAARNLAQKVLVAGAADPARWVDEVILRVLCRRSIPRNGTSFWPPRRISTTTISRLPGTPRPCFLSGNRRWIPLSIRLSWPPGRWFATRC